MTDTPVNEQWHLDKRIPIALIATILIGYTGGVVWVSSISSEVMRQGRDLERVEDEVDKRTLQNTDASNRIIRIEEKLANQNEILQEIKSAVSGLRATPKELQLR